MVNHHNFYICYRFTFESYVESKEKEKSEKKTPVTYPNEKKPDLTIPLLDNFFNIYEILSRTISSNNKVQN